jgi:hypothetical protein
LLLSACSICSFDNTFCGSGSAAGACANSGAASQVKAHSNAKLERDNLKRPILKRPILKRGILERPNLECDARFVIRII